jgi:hypothetical protein
MATKTFADHIRAYAQWKLQEKGESKITSQELRALRESFKPSTDGKDRLEETVAEYRKWKLKEKGTAKITKREFEVLKERTQAPAKTSLAILVENYRRFKSASLGIDARVSYKEMKALTESFKRSNGRLREADAGYDPTAGMAPPPSAPGVPGADPNGVQADPALVAQIQDVKNSVDALATAAGIQTGDFNADPNAGIPAVDGAAQPQAAAPQQVFESLAKEYRNWKYKKTGNGNLTNGEIKRLKETAAERFAQSAPKTRLDTIKERIAKRQAQLEGLNENAAQELGKKTLSRLGGPQQRDNFSPDASTGTAAKPDGTPSDELVKIPGEGALAAGVGSKGATSGKTWPTKKAKDLGALQGKSASQNDKAQTKVYEQEEGEEDALRESAISVTDAYVDRELSTEKLDFNAIRSSLKSGLLG